MTNNAQFGFTSFQDMAGMKMGVKGAQSVW